MSDPYRNPDQRPVVVNSGSDSGIAVIAGIVVALVIVVGGIYWVYGRGAVQTAANDKTNITVNTPAPRAPAANPAPATPAPATPTTPPASR